MTAGSAAPERVVYVVRHGQTERSARHIYSGRADIPLTPAGLEQARLAGERLRDAGVDGICSSPLIRAADTARVIGEATGAPVSIDERLTEVDYGPVEGLDREAARRRHGPLFAAWREDPFASPLPGMESLHEALERAGLATRDALRRYERPVIVGHQGILRLVLMALGEVQRDAYFSTRLDEADPIEVRVQRGPRSC